MLSSFIGVTALGVTLDWGEVPNHCAGVKDRKIVTVDHGEKGKAFIECQDEEQDGKEIWKNEKGKVTREANYNNGTLQYRRDWYDDGTPQGYIYQGPKVVFEYSIQWDESGNVQYEEGGPPPSSITFPSDIRKLLPKKDLIPPDIIKKGSAYIAGEVGQEYFENNYKFVRPKSSYNKWHVNPDYELTYDYVPLSRVDPGRLITVSVSGNEGSQQKGFVAVIKSSPASEKRVIIEPKITRQQALHIISKLKLPKFEKTYANLKLDSELWIPGNRGNAEGWTWMLYYDDPDFGWTDTPIGFVTIDATTGKVLDQRGL